MLGRVLVLASSPGCLAGVGVDVTGVGDGVVDPGPIGEVREAELTDVTLQRD